MGTITSAIRKVSPTQGLNGPISAVHSLNNGTMDYSSSNELKNSLTGLYLKSRMNLVQVCLGRRILNHDLPTELMAQGY